MRRRCQKKRAARCRAAPSGTETNSINRYSSAARGVIVMRLAEGDRVVAIAAFRAGLADRQGIGDNDGPDGETPGPGNGSGA